MSTAHDPGTPPRSHDRGSASELAQHFQNAAAELVSVQRELSHLYALAADPLAEADTALRRAELLQRRDSLLALWARLGLSWLMQGGSVLLGDGGRLAAEPRDRPSAPSATPASSARLAALPEQEAAAPPPQPPARVIDISTLERGFSPAWTRSPSVVAPQFDPRKLRDLMRALEPPPGDLEDEAAVREELRRIADATSAPAMQQWLEFPKDIQRSLVGMIVARARHVQDEVPPSLHPITVDQELDRFFSTMTAFSKREQPGFVFGLRRHHHPVAERWSEDALRWWNELVSCLPEPLAPNPERALDELRQAIDDGASEDQVVQQALQVLDAGVSSDDPRLVRMMIPHQDKLRKHTRFKRLRKAIRDLISDDEVVEAETAQDTAALPADWPWHSFVRGKRAVIVGGDLREDARRRLQEVFGFESLDWVTTDHSRNLQNLAASIRSGAVDLVIILRRFIGHIVDRTLLPACRASNVAWVSVERGYGTSQLRLAIERFLASGPPAAKDEEQAGG